MLRGWCVNVLQRLAEIDPGEDVSEAATAIGEFQRCNEGLHAKTFVLDLTGSRSTVITGSANLTSAGWGSSVEFDAVLTGPTWGCGVAAVLDGSAEALIDKARRHLATAGLLKDTDLEIAFDALYTAARCR